MRVRFASRCRCRLRLNAGSGSRARGPTPTTGSARAPKKHGYVWMGDRRQPSSPGTPSVHVDARKFGNRWMVDTDAFEAALNEHRLVKAETERITEACKEHRLDIGPGGSRETSWGGYSVQTGFHLTWYNGSRENGGGEGSWFCNACWAPARREHNKDGPYLLGLGQLRPGLHAEPNLLPLLRHVDRRRTYFGESSHGSLRSRNSGCPTPSDII
jgi:hypothetical protein